MHCDWWNLLLKKKYIILLFLCFIRICEIILFQLFIWIRIKSKQNSYIRSVYICCSECNQNGNASLLTLFLAQEAEVKYAEWDSIILIVHLFAKEHALVIHNLIIQLWNIWIVWVHIFKILTNLCCFIN